MGFSMKCEDEDEVTIPFSPAIVNEVVVDTCNKSDSVVELGSDSKQSEVKVKMGRTKGSKNKVSSEGTLKKLVDIVGVGGIEQLNLPFSDSEGSPIRVLDGGLRVGELLMMQSPSQTSQNASGGILNPSEDSDKGEPSKSLMEAIKPLRNDPEENLEILPTISSKNESILKLLDKLSDSGGELQRTTIPAISLITRETLEAKEQAILNQQTKSNKEAFKQGLIDLIDKYWPE